MGSGEAQELGSSRLERSVLGPGVLNRRGWACLTAYLQFYFEGNRETVCRFLSQKETLSREQCSVLER